MGSAVPFLAFVLALAAAWPARADDPGLFIAVGLGGRRIASRDGLAWENDQRWTSGELRGPDDALVDVAYGAGRFVAVGGGAKSGCILTSRNGIEWQDWSPGEGRVTTIAFGNGRFVAVHRGELLASADGDGFQAGERLPWKGNVHAQRSACGDTEAGFRFVIIGDVDSGDAEKRVFWRGSTEDGSRWDHSAIDTPEARDVAYGAGLFVVVGPDGRIESSHDGQTWQQRAATPGEEFSRIVWTGTHFLVSGGTVAWSSADGLTWAKEAEAIPCDLAWVREGFLGLGFSPAGGVYFSRDLVRWDKAVIPPSPSLQAVAWRPAARR